MSATGIEFDQGQNLQLQLLHRWLSIGESIGGWKIGMTSGANRNAMGDGIRPFGFILHSRIVRSHATLPLSPLHKGQLENELCFLMGKQLGPDATPASARQAVAGILPAFEINQKRLGPGAGAGLRVADNLSNWGIVIGESVAPIDDLSRLTVSLSKHQDLIERVESPGFIDDHYESLAILARRLAAFDQRLEAGQYVITGAYAKTPFAAGDYTGTFDLGIGPVHITLA